MEVRKVDFIIVGQGLAGSWLANELMKRGQRVMVFDQESEQTSTLKAAGLYNPITGRKMVRTWMAANLFDRLEQDYQTLEQATGEKFLYSIPIYRPFLDIEESNDWQVKVDDSDFTPYIADIRSASIEVPGVQDSLGGIVLRRTGYVDLPTFVKGMRNLFVNAGVYRSEVFDYGQLSLEGESSVLYKDLEASKIIFCEGPASSNPYWTDLPFKSVRGELLDVECNIKSEFIINRGVFMIPKKGFFTVGSTYDHRVLSFEPQADGIEELKRRLGKLFTGAYQIVDQRAGVRPSTFDRKPFLGLHKKFKTIGIFNGLGTKGVSLAPYFAAQYASFLLGQGEIEKEANVKRVN